MAVCVVGESLSVCNYMPISFALYVYDMVYSELEKIIIVAVSDSEMIHLCLY